MGERICAWVPDAASRTVERQGDAWSLVAPAVLDAPLPLRAETVKVATKLCEFKHTFLLKHARAA